MIGDEMAKIIDEEGSMGIVMETKHWLHQK